MLIRMWLQGRLATSLHCATHFGDLLTNTSNPLCKHEQAEHRSRQATDKTTGAPAAAVGGGWSWQNDEEFALRHTPAGKREHSKLIMHSVVAVTQVRRDT